MVFGTSSFCTLRLCLLVFLLNVADVLYVVPTVSATRSERSSKTPKRISIPIKSQTLHQPRIRQVKEELVFSSGDNYEVDLVNRYDRIFTGSLWIGPSLKHAQQFELIFDTGSADLWVYGSENRCKKCAQCGYSSNGCCPKQAVDCCFFQNDMNAYFANESTSSKCYKGCKSWHIEYGKGAAKGHLYEDTVWMGDGPNGTSNVKATRQVFASASWWDQTLVSCAEPMDGILGFAMKAAAQSDASSLIENLYKQGIIDSKVFSVRLRSGPLQKDGSMFIIGEPMEEFYEGDIVYSSVVQPKKTGMWYAELKGILRTWNSSHTAEINAESVSLKAAGSEWLDECPNDDPCVALIDTGTSYIIMPQKKRDSLVQAIVSVSDLAANCFESGGQFACKGRVVDRLPTLWFQFGHKAFSLGPRQYMLNNSCTTYGRYYCMGISGSNAMGAHTYILGDTFLRHYYVIFDESKARIGFGAMHSTATARSRSGDRSKHVVELVMFALAFCVCVFCIGSVAFKRMRADAYAAGSSGVNRFSLTSQMVAYRPSVSPSPATEALSAVVNGDALANADSVRVDSEAMAGMCPAPQPFLSQGYRLGSASVRRVHAVGATAVVSSDLKQPMIGGSSEKPAVSLASELPRGAPLGKRQDDDYAAL